MAEERAEKHVEARHAAAGKDEGGKRPYVLNRASTYLEGREYGHGDEIRLDPERGDELAEAGVVVAKSDWERHQADESGVDEEQANAEREAEEGAAEIEASKVRAAEQARAANNEPAPVRRGRPPTRG